MTPDVWRNRKVLLTGHTGFKGAWLAFWLKQLGADVAGLGLDPRTSPSHWDLLGLDMPDHRIDLRDADAVRSVVEEIKPDIIFHLAAQALVRRSYQDPIETWSSNVMGAVHLFEAARAVPTVRSIVCITSDKCYENVEWDWGYRETDALGGIDPYSASKAAVELVAGSYRSAFFAKDGPLLATTRAGNVIGGGDGSEDRLIPDLVRATTKGETLIIRSPHATRPWQHVLEPLSGYLLLAERLIQGDRTFAQAWNFGPDAEANQPVSVMLQLMQKFWPAVRWQVEANTGPYESTLLHLDSAKARRHLGWAPVWSLTETLEQTAAWYRQHHETGTLATATQWQAYVSAAKAKGLAWAQSVGRAA